MVLKADGLATGKGVFVCVDQVQAQKALFTIMKEKAFGDAGNRVVIEECLEGEEAYFIAFTDGKDVVPLASSRTTRPSSTAIKALTRGVWGLILRRPWSRRKFTTGL